MKIKKSPLKTTKIQRICFHNVYWVWFKFTRNICDVRCSWRSGIRCCWHPGYERFEPVYGSCFFVRNPVTAAKIKFSPLKTANLTKVHRFHRIHFKKMRALCGENFFHSYSPQFLHYFSTKPRPGDHAKISTSKEARKWWISNPIFDYATVSISKRIL